MIKFKLLLWIVKSYLDNYVKNLKCEPYPIKKKGFLFESGFADIGLKPNMNTTRIQPTYTSSLYAILILYQIEL